MASSLFGRFVVRTAVSGCRAVPPLFIHDIAKGSIMLSPLSVSFSRIREIGKWSAFAQSSQWPPIVTLTSKTKGRRYHNTNTMATQGGWGLLSLLTTHVRVTSADLA
ncbi:uncharacterized protein LY79DRAFT_251334 [Colletotrichum navitas]|uniref:Uncharacterized protein n=1 Tax=Colletotrichum navitas TaxID=681940 RepID=A0AAD8Q9U6_9PEZI|nr:uncharacterized protein LY79DRAFT_251334 [Colletotrichum navitas]KAK1598658.1 hypothetical protein LY79DRAFT_251334 [Colletotrichum navitas]